MANISVPIKIDLPDNWMDLILKRIKEDGDCELEYLFANRRWIPCNERLPDSRIEVNVSCHDDSGDTPFDYTSCGWMTTDKEYWIVDNEINNFVVVWMPFPEPYKEADHERRHYQQTCGD